MGSKVCTKCKETKDYSEYGYRKEGKLHLQSHCKKCQAISALATKKKTDPIVIKNRQHKSRENNIIRNTDEIISSKLNLKKICRFCNKLLFFKEFGVDKTRADGFVSKCRTCVNEADRTRYSVNRDSLRARKLDYQKSNPDIYRSAALKYYYSNKEFCRENNKVWSKENTDKRNASYSKRKLSKLGATPGWADLKEISRFYERAKILTRETGIKYSVDHIIPIQGELVCGLHVENNLRVIPLIENISKKNKLVKELLVEEHAPTC